MQTFIEFNTEEKSPYSSEWGWITPQGKYINGLKTKGAKYHCDLLPAEFGEYRSASTTDSAVKKGWVRFCIDKMDTGAATFNLNRYSHGAINRVRDFLAKPPVKIPSDVPYIIEPSAFSKDNVYCKTLQDFFETLDSYDN